MICNRGRVKTPWALTGLRMLPGVLAGVLAFPATAAEAALGDLDPSFGRTTGFLAADFGSADRGDRR